MINLDDNQGSAGLLPQPRFPGSGPSWPNLGEDEPLNVQQEYMAQRRALESERLSKLYLDEKEFARVANQPEIRDGRRMSLLGEDLPKVALNAAYLSHRLGRKVTADEYELARDSYAAANFGQEAVTDGQFFDLVKGQYDVRRQKTEALDELRLRMAAQSLEDGVNGAKTPAVNTWKAWKEKHRELVGDEEDLPYLAAAVAERNEFQQVVDKYKHLAAPGLDLLKKFTAGEASGEELSDFAKTLAGVPREEQDTVIDLIALGADGGQIDRGALKEFARSMGQTFSRGFNFIPQRVMQDRELGVTNFLEAVQNGVEVYIPIGGDIGQAVVGNAPAGAAAEALAEGSWRQATEQEREQMVAGTKQALAVFRLERQLRAVADGNVDPIKRMFKGGVSGAIEGGVLGVAGSLPLLTATAVNPFAGMLAYQSIEYDRMLTENPDMDVRAAMGVSAIEGAWQAALDRLQLKTLQGALPVTGRLLGQIKSTGLRRTLGFAASGAEQFGQELAQDIGTLAIDTIASAVREDMEDKSFTLELGEYWKQAPEVLVSSLIFGMWGGGAITARELRGTPAEWDEAARIVGISEEGRKRMRAATTPEELDTVVERELKNVTPESQAAGALYAKAKRQAAEAAQADPNEPTLEVVKDEEGNSLYRITTPDGETLIETRDAQAAQAAFLDYRTASETNEVQALKDVISYWQNRDPELSIKEAPAILVKEELDRLEGIGDAAGIERLRQRLVAADIDPDGDLTGVQIFGSTTVQEVGENVYRGTILVRQGAAPETVLEEVNHAFVRRALMRGDVTVDQLSAWLDQTAAATGLDIKRGNEVEIIESIAQVGMDLFNGRLDQAQLPQSLVDYLRRLMRVVKEIYLRAVKVTEAFDRGEIDGNFEQFLMQSMGMNPQQQIDINSTTTAAAVATGAAPEDFSVGITVAPLRRDTLSELSKNEVRKRAKSAKFIHLQQVIDDITSAYGVKVLSRQPVIETWTEKGRVSLEVPESILADTDDLDLAEEIAALIAISAPELQNGAMIWRDDPKGPDVIISFKAKSAEAAMEIAEQFNKAGVMGSSYDVNTRTFSVAMVGATAEDIKELTDYVEYHTGQGRVTPGAKGSKSYQGRAGTGKFPGEAQYRGYLQAARDRADQLGGQRGAALRDVVSRAERRLDRQTSAAKIARKAQRALKKLNRPKTSAALIESELKGRTFDNIRQLGLYLDARFRQIHGKPAFEIGSKEGIDSASDALLYDILDGLATDGSGMGWYDERVQETIRELAKTHPEFADDPLALSVYIGILASTSQGYTVVENFKQADRVYAAYKATGRLPLDLEFAKGNDPINSNLAQIQQLIDTYGLEGYAEFMDAEVTGQALRDQYGMQPTGVTLKDVVRGNRVLGPKIGSFFNNLRGRFDTITIDLWYTRTMHRYLGETVVPLESEKMQKALSKFRSELKKKGARTYGLDLKEALKDDESTVQAALTLFQRWARGKNEYAEKGYMKFSDGYAVEKAARTIFASGGMKGAPQNKTHRNYFADVVLAAQAKLADLGFKLNVADMQAIVWYREKNLFGRTGVANAAAKPADYLDAVMVSRRRADAQEDVDAADLVDELDGATFDYSVGREKAQRPTDPLTSPTGHLDWGIFTEWDAQNSGGKITAGPIRMLKGKTFGPNKGYGIEHIEDEHARDFSRFSDQMEAVIHRAILGFNEVYLQPNGNLLLVARRPTVATAVQLRPEAGGFYSVVTSFPKENPAWKPNGVRILDGRRAAFAQSERAPGLTAQEGSNPNLPREPLPGKYSWDYLRSLSEPVNSQNELFSLGRPRVDRALASAMNRKPGERLAMYERAKQMFDRVAARRAGLPQEPGETTAGGLERIEAEKAAALAEIDRLEEIDIAEAQWSNLEKFNAEAKPDWDERTRKDAERKARERGRILEKGIRDKYNEQRKATEAGAKAKRLAAENAAKADNRQRKLDYEGNLKFSKALQGLWELDAILKVLPPEVRAKVGGYTSMAALGKDSPTGPTQEAVDKFLDKRLEMVGKQLDRYLASEYRIAIERTLEAAKPKRTESGVRKSNLGPEAQAYADKALAASNLDNDQTAQRLAAIEAELLDSNTTDERKVDLVEEWGLVNTFGDIEGRNAETLAQGYAELKDRLKAGRDNWRIQQEARIAEQRSLVAGIISTLGEPSTVKRFATKSQIQQLSEFLTAAGLDHGNFEQFLTGLGLDDALVARWSEALRKADNSAQDMELAMREELLEAIKATGKASGMSTSAAMRMLKNDSPAKVRKIDNRKVKDVSISIELAKKIVNGTADRSDLSQGDIETLRETLAALPADTRKKKVTITQVIFAGAPVEVTVTPAQAIQLELSWDQPDLQEKMRREGWTDESIEDIRAITSEPVPAGVLAFLRGFYARNYATVNPVYARMFGMNMPQTKFYAPGRFVSAKQQNDISLDGSPMVTGSTPGFAKSRVAHSSPIASMDALTVFQQHVVQTAHWVNFAEFAREARAVVNNIQVQQSIEQKFGRPTLDGLNAWIEQLEQRGANKSRELGWMSGAVGNYLGGTAISSLGFNLKTVFVQVDSAMRFLLALDPRQIGRALMNPVELAKAMPKAWFSPSVQRRLKGGMNPAAQFLFARGSTKPGPLSNLAWLAMQPIQIFDAAATTLSSAMVFRATYQDALDAGMNETQAEAVALDALDAAIYRYSQPTGFGSKSNVENTSGAFGKLLTLFMSDPRLKTGALFGAVREMSRGKNIGLNVQRILAIEAMALVSHVIAAAYRDAFTDDEDEDIWSVEGFGLALALAPFQGLFLAGALSESALRYMLGMKVWAPPSAPYAGNLESAYRGLKNMDQLFYPETLADGFKAWNNLLRGAAISVPFGAPAALANILKPFIGLQQNLEADE